MGVEIAAIAGFTSFVSGGLSMGLENEALNEERRLAQQTKDDEASDFTYVENEYRTRLDALDRDTEDARTLLGLNTGKGARTLTEGSSDALESAMYSGNQATGQAEARMAASGVESGSGTAGRIVSQVSGQSQRLIDKINERFGGQWGSLITEHDARYGMIGQNDELNRTLLANEFERNKNRFDRSQAELHGILMRLNDPAYFQPRLWGAFFGGAAQGLQFTKNAFSLGKDTFSFDKDTT